MNFEQYPEVLAGPPKPSSILQPNIFSMPAGVERFVVEGSGAILIPVYLGDNFTISNDEGGQVCEILSADKKGHIDTMILGETANNDARGLKHLLDSNDQSLIWLRLGLKSRGIDLSSAKGISVFDSLSKPKAEAKFNVKRDVIIVISAPGHFMDFEKQNTTTSLTVHLKRSSIKLHFILY